MFDTFPGFWTPVMGAAELRDQPVGMTLAGERIVLFRGKDGVGALLDRCPHRGVALSLGKVVDGTLECPFHGWRFDSRGGCAHIPMNPGAQRGGTTALPVRERGHLIWVYTGLQTDTEPYVPPALLREGGRIEIVHEEWRTHWTRAMENMLDSPHLPWVHGGTIGRGLRAQLRPDSTMHQELIDREFGFEAHFRMDEGEPGQINWLRPNGMELFILDTPRAFMRMHSWCIPTTHNHTRMLVVGVKDFGWAINPFLGLTEGFNRRVLGEDRHVLESSDPPRVPPPNQEQNVPTDKVTLRFRTWYHKHLAPLDDASEARRAAGGAA